MSVAINDLYGSLSTATLGADSLSGMASAGTLTNSIQDASTSEEMMAACEEFEVYLLQKMFQSMEETTKIFSDEDEEDGGEYMNMFNDKLYQSVAENMVKSGQGIGLAKTLYESMARNAGLTTGETEAEAEVQ